MIDYLGSMDDLVVLGMSFLQTVMKVYNWDEKTISCKCLLSGREYQCADLGVVGELKK
jgi:hypothetical protein